MAADVTSGDATPADHPPRRSSPHFGRFLFVYGTLAAVLVLAVVGIVIYAGRSISPGPTWSAWKPHGGGLGAAKEIAAHIGGGYRLPSGKQLGMRRFIKILQEVRELPLDQAVSQVVNQVDAARAAKPQEDDFVLCMVERRA